MPSASVAILTSICLAVHILAGAVGAFIAFPLALFAKKGGPLHRRAGIAFVSSFVAICLTGYILDFEELQGIITRRDWFFLRQARIDNLGTDIRFFLTVTINTLALYFAASGYRVWRRRTIAAQGRRAWFDGIVGIIGTLSVITFAVAIFLSLPILNQEGHAFARMPFEYIVLGILIAVALLETGRDCYLSIFLPQKQPKWWVIHMRKMLTAEAGLLAAFGLRCLKAQYVEIGMAVPVLLLILVGVILRWRGFNFETADRT